MGDIDGRTTVFESGGLRDRPRDYLGCALRAVFSPGIKPEDVPTEDAAVPLAAKLKTPP